ncbi:hypothetical protein CDQ83_01735 [Clostridium thermosuccinogenes]|nr:hypothetical protein CDQ83_01735 [Pseudoclostridium thermosuccinogenes]
MFILFLLNNLQLFLDTFLVFGFIAYIVFPLLLCSINPKHRDAPSFITFYKSYTELDFSYIKR